MKEINVLYASDDNFAEVLGISICSLVLSTKTKLNIYVVDQGMKKENRDLIHDMVVDSGNKINFIKSPDFSAIIGETVDISRYSMSMFSRLLAGTLLPEEVSRVIYLDCDTMIKKDLTPLFEYDLSGKIVGAVNDLRNGRYMRNLGLEKKYCYINSGVLLIDLEKYREFRCEDKFMEALKKFNGLLEFPDNDLICMVLSNYIELIPPKYNAYSIFFACEYKELKTFRYPSHMPTENEYYVAKNDPFVVHFTTCVFFNNRPWNDSCNHPLTQEYIRIRDQSPWRMLTLRKSQVSSKKQLQMKLISILPRALSTRMFGLVHAFIKPDIQYFSKKRYLKIFPYQM